MRRHPLASVLSVTVAMLTLSGGVAMASTPATSNAADQPTSAVPGLRHAVPASAADRGAATGTQRVTLSLASKDKAGLDAFVAGRHAPLTPAEFTARFGPSDQGLTAIQGWAAKNGLAVQHDAGSMILHLTGPAKAVNAAFGTSLHAYKAADKSYVAAAGDASLPAGIARFATSVVGLGAPATAHLASEGQTAKPAASGYGPADFTKFYNAPSTATGSGQKLAIITIGDLTDVKTNLGLFEDHFNLPKVPITVVPIDGGSSDTSGDIEWELDTQYSTGFAPDVSGVTAYSATSLDDAALTDAFSKWVDDDSISQASASFGSCETASQSSGNLTATDTVLEKAAAQGQSLFVSSGDTGSKCGTVNGTVSGPEGVSYPASSPYAVAVGGTQITDLAGGTEEGWYAGGGGQSPNEKAQSWQTSVGGAYTGSARGVPDVSLSAEDFQMYYNGSIIVEGGTSASAPSWQGVWARVQQAAGGKAGFAAPALYQAGSALRDITSGNNGDFSAASGWDYVTGLGTPDITALTTAIKPTS
jgi:pseudomonalisin